MIFISIASVVGTKPGIFVCLKRKHSLLANYKKYLIIKRRVLLRRTCSLFIL